MLVGLGEAFVGRAFADGYRAFGTIVKSADDVKMATGSCWRYKRRSEFV